jgi:uncharacterized protein (TIGR02231 family)
VPVTQILKVMKRIQILLGFILSIGQVSFAAEKNYKSKVEKATVYLQGAQLSHSVDAMIPQGSSNIIIEGVSPYLDQQSLQAAGKGTFTIVDVSFNVKYPDETPIVTVPKVNKYLKQMNLFRDSIEDIDFSLSGITDRRTQFEIEKNLLLNNKMIKGEFKRDSLSMFKDAMEFLRMKMNNINAELLKLRREENKLNKAKASLEERLDNLEALTNKVDEVVDNKPKLPVYQAIVNVFADVATQGKISINYFVANASWMPDYELRASNTTNQINLIHKANVQQNTAVDWNDVKLTLSTGNPMLNNNKPELTSFYINFYQPYTYSNELKAMKKPSMAATSREALEKEEMPASTDAYFSAMPDAKKAEEFTEVIENRIKIDYSIDLKCNIAADAKFHQVTILKKDINAEFEYYAAPKLDKDAFLIAKVTNWEDLNLLPGSARIYFDGAYIGKTYINVNNNNDTLALNLGRDNTISIIRKKVKEKSKNMMTSNDKITTQTYSITLRNTKQTNLNIDIEDMIPLSSNESIVIKTINLDGARHEPESGRLTWKIKLKAHESKVINYGYEIRFPKDKLISGL